MKRLIALLLALAVCLCAAGCVSSKEKQATEENKPTVADTETTQPTDAQAQSTTAPQETEGNVPESIPVPNTGEMPQAPSADYTLPPDERPGDRVTNAPTS